MATRKFLGLLCDLDGTLVDSEPLHCTAWLETLADYGRHYDAHWFEQWVGTSDTVLARHEVEVEQLPVTQEQLISEKRDRYHAAVLREGQIFPGVYEALQRIIDAGIPFAIATNSGREDADVMIGAAKLGRYTDVSVSASDVEHMKPAPDIYELAAARLGIDATDCIAIEDSGPGGKAATAAGCYLIGLTDKVEPCDERIDDQATAILRALELLDTKTS